MMESVYGKENGKLIQILWSETKLIALQMTLATGHSWPQWSAEEERKRDKKKGDSSTQGANSCLVLSLALSLSRKNSEKFE